MRQRAALLRTFLTGQDVILLDEPFGSLDALTRQTMQQWLLEVWKEEQKTIIAVTHDIDEALLMSDRVYVMGARPSQMLDCVEVRLPRPRTPTSPEFVALKTTLMEPVSAAVLAQQRSSGVPA
jgi:ABC-type nitrate/sulfonate/bicarbonate transport system ATPase subunit